MIFIVIIFLFISPCAYHKHRQDNAKGYFQGGAQPLFGNRADFPHAQFSYLEEFPQVL